MWTRSHSDACQLLMLRFCLILAILYVFVVQSLSHVQLLVTPWTAACQTPPSFTISWSLLKPMSIESVMPSNHLLLCCRLLLLPSIFSSIRVFSKELALHMRCPNYWSSSFSISLSNEHLWLISFRIDWFPVCSAIYLKF